MSTFQIQQNKAKIKALESKLKKMGTSRDNTNVNPEKFTKAKKVKVYGEQEVNGIKEALEKAITMLGQGVTPDMLEALKKAEVSRYRGIVNDENEEKYFGMVSPDYTVVQHHEVDQLVQDALNDLDLQCDAQIMEMGDGGRLRIFLTFPDIKFDASGEGDYISMVMLFDNSYDGSTGLRAQVIGYRYLTESYLGYDKMSQFYHRHTKNLDTKAISKTIERGVTFFTDQLQKQILNMASKPITKREAIDFIDECIEKKTISVKYLEQMKNTIINGSIFKTGEVDNHYKLLGVISEVLTHYVESIDARERHLTKMQSELKKLKTNDLT